MMTITSNYYGDIRVKFLCLMFTLTSAFSSAWRDLTIHVGEFCLLHVQLNFWSEPSPSLKQKRAGIRLRVDIGKHNLCHFTILPLIPFLSHYKKPWSKFASHYNLWVWRVAKHFVDRRYSKKWDRFQKRDANRWAGVTGNGLLEFKPLAIPSLIVPETLTAKLLGTMPKGKGCATFQLCGIPVAEGWRKSWEERDKPYPYCDISIWGEIKEGAQLSSYGGELWPSAWPDYFRPPMHPNKNNVGAVYLTQKGAELLQSL